MLLSDWIRWITTVMCVTWNSTGNVDKFRSGLSGLISDYVYFNLCMTLWQVQGLADIYMSSSCGNRPGKPEVYLQNSRYAWTSSCRKAFVDLFNDHLVGLQWALSHAHCISPSSLFLSPTIAHAHCAPPPPPASPSPPSPPPLSLSLYLYLTPQLWCIYMTRVKHTCMSKYHLVITY